MISSCNRTNFYDEALLQKELTAVNFQLLTTSEKKLAFHEAMKTTMEQTRLLSLWYNFNNFEKDLRGVVIFTDKFSGHDTIQMNLTEFSFVIDLQRLHGF